MFNSKPTYTPVSPESHAELADWQEDPQESIESRNRTIGIHHRPGFYSKSLLISVGLNAILLMVIGYQYFRLTRFVACSAYSTSIGDSILTCQSAKAAGGSG